jgi:hypothetical protein
MIGPSIATLAAAPNAITLRPQPHNPHNLKFFSFYLFDLELHTPNFFLHPSHIRISRIFHDLQFADSVLEPLIEIRIAGFLFARD